MENNNYRCSLRNRVIEATVSTAAKNNLSVIYLCSRVISKNKLTHANKNKNQDSPLTLLYSNKPNRLLLSGA